MITHDTTTCMVPNVTHVTLNSFLIAFHWFGSLHKNIYTEALGSFLHFNSTAALREGTA